MTSIGPQQGFDLQFLHLLIDAFGHDFHRFIVTSEISPTDPFPVFRGHGPISSGGMEYLPQVLEVFGVGVDQLIVDGG